MKWENCLPKCGEIIRTPVGNFYHYGIFKNNNEVIQFGKNPIIRNDNNLPICVCSSSLSDFLCNNTYQVLLSENDNVYDTKKTLKIALSRLGEEGYNILYNNCEHFVYECAFQKKLSFQIDNIREQLKNIDNTNLYIASIPTNKIDKVSCKDRQKLIDNTTNTSLKNQRYFVWKLLEHALMHSYGFKIEEINFSVDKNGKWHCKECYFSLSHCADAVAVAVSKKPVGVDIENANHIFHKGFAEKFLTKNELKEYNDKNDKEKSLYLLKSWCAKESIFKANNDDVFCPSEIQHNINTKTGIINVKNDSFCYSVCCNNTEKINIYNNINL